MGLSVNEYTYSGSDEFDLGFALGYDKQTDISAEVDDGGGLPVVATFDFVTDNRIRITSPALNTGDVIRVLRTVSKTDPAVDVSQPSNLSRENVQKLFLQSMYVMHEVLDSRVAGVGVVEDEVQTIAAAAVADALALTPIVASYKFPVQISGDMTAPVVVVCGNNMTLTETVVYIETNPSAAVEVLLSDSAKVVYSFNVATNGTVTETYALPDPQTIVKGPITATITGGNYATGLKFHASIVGITDETLEFPDILAIYNGAKT